MECGRGVLEESDLQSALGLHQEQTLHSVHRWVQVALTWRDHASDSAYKYDPFGQYSDLSDLGHVRCGRVGAVAGTLRICKALDLDMQNMGDASLRHPLALEEDAQISGNGMNGLLWGKNGKGARLGAPGVRAPQPSVDGSQRFRATAA